MFTAYQICLYYACVKIKARYYCKCWHYLLPRYIMLIALLLKKRHLWQVWQHIYYSSELRHSLPIPQKLICWRYGNVYFIQNYICYTFIQVLLFVSRNYIFLLLTLKHHVIFFKWKQYIFLRIVLQKTTINSMATLKVLTETT